MLKLGRSLIAGLALMAFAAPQAHADGSWAGNGSYCGGSLFSTCYSVDLSWAGAGTTLAVTLRLKNDDPQAGLKWFAVGLDNLPSDVTGTLVSGPAGYGNPPPNDLTGSPFVPNTVSASNPGGSAPGSTFLTWTFTLTGDSRTAAQWDAVMNAAGVGLHAGGTACGSTKVVARDNLAGGSAYGTNSGPPSACDFPDPNTSIAPEPATMGLLALGLVGMGGVGFLRRRRKV